MTGRKINFTSRQFARLAGYKLVFNKKANGGEYTYANIVASDNDVTEGVLYEFPDNDISKLDVAEGCPYHYYKIEVEVIDINGNTITATTYVAHADKIVTGLHPRKEYLSHLLAGRDMLSIEYYDSLCRTQTCD